jgi:hypothetical protein
MKRIMAAFAQGDKVFFREAVVAEIGPWLDVMRGQPSATLPAGLACVVVAPEDAASKSVLAFEHAHSGALFICQIVAVPRMVRPLHMLRENVLQAAASFRVPCFQTP